MKHAVAQMVAIVEDDPRVRRSVTNLFRSVGMQVQAHASAEEFLASYRARPGASTDVACLVLDLRLPGMSGLELVHQLSADGSNLPIVILSAQLEPATVRGCLLAGVIACYPKPFQAQELLKTVSECLHRHD